ncbi:MAG: AAA family ATPase [Candidatus Moranbacteria bacterium]|nr:AAA family ATPase [Candidatus Moranbacteria bacterium]
MKDKTKEIIGHKRQRNILERMLKREMFPQAVMFTGPEHVGKETIAMACARCLVAGKENLEIDTTKVNEMVDIIIIRPEKEEKRGVVKEKVITAKQIGNCKEKTGLHTYSGKKKVLIINDAHKMTRVAQNSLLKTVEEPGKNLVIIITTHEPDSVIETIHSRCQKMVFELVPEEEMVKIIGYSEKARTMSAGRPGAAMGIIQEQEIQKKYEEIRKEWKDLETKDMVYRFATAEKMAKNVPETIEKVQEWIRYAHDEWKESITSSGARKQVEVLCATVNTMTKTNANTRLVLEDMMINLWSAKREQKAEKQKN